MNEYPEAKLLVVDDEQDMLRLLKRGVSSDLKCRLDTATSAYQAQALINSDDYDLILLDIRMPGMDGMEFLEKLRHEHPDIAILMMTGYGIIDLAVEAIKKGAYDFLTKPFDLDNVIHIVARALERTRLIRQNRLLQRKLREQEGAQEIVGSSAKILQALDTIRLVANSDATILVTGESGTGKDLAARAIHRSSPRGDQPFVTVNCPNLPEQILESELFGHRKGAFTHATKDKRGLFWEARGGTIYLDEIGDISGTLQTKLLRILQDKEVRPLGDTKSIKVDVRIIASTNQNLRKRMEQKQFREDLFYRLNVISIHMPSLRERGEDVPLLVQYFLEKCCKDQGTVMKRISPELLDRLSKYQWPGNVRELENLIKRAVILSPGTEIGPAHVQWDSEEQSECLVTDQIKTMQYADAKRLVLERFHHEYISEALFRNQGNVTRAAKECGLERQSLQRVIKRYGIKSEDFK